MNLRTLWLALALGASPLVANAQISADVSFNWSSSAPQGEPVASVDVFYDQLSPYGVWIDDPTVGQAFIPEQQGYVPYQNGHWENTDVGFVWISDEPFAWATSHYGRWWFSNDYGRWVWVPDTTWGPSWVDWYEADDNLGWAPLAPDIVIQAGYQVPYAAYHYCPAEHVLDRDVTRYYVAPQRVEVIQRQARPIAYRANIGSHQVIAGPQPERLAAHRVRAPQVKHVEAKTMGRMPATELRAAEQRAQQRKPQLEQQNAKRLEAHADIQKVVQQRATKAPARANTRPTEPNRAEPNRAEPNRAEPNKTPTSRPEPNRAEPNRTEPNKTPMNRAEPNKTPTSRPEPNRAEPNRAEPNRAEPTRPEPNATTPRPEPTRAPATRPEAARPEPARPEPQRAEPARPEMNREPASRPEPKATMPRPEPARPEPPRAEPARPEPQRAEPARPEPQRAEPARPEPHAAPARGHDKADDKRRP